MSWLDKLENSKFEIQTGDGKTFYPLWKTGEKSKDFNTATFNFINLEGSYVKRKKPQSNKHTLVFYFQGEDNIEQSDAFETSANDARAWKVQHPFYGNLLGQPLSLSRNDSSLNITEITVDFWETIAEGGTKKKVSTVDGLKSMGVTHKDTSAQIYASKIDIKPIDQSTIKQNVSNFSLKYDSLLDDVNYAEYQAAVSKAMQSVDEMILYPVQAIKDINTLINIPAQFVKSVKQRLNLAKEIFKDIKDVLQLNNNKANKTYFEAMAGAVIGSMTLSAVNFSDGEFYSRNQVQQTADLILQYYQEYLLILDQSQAPIEDISNSFFIGFEGQLSLSSMVFEAVYNLYNLAFEAKQEREIVLDKDSNLILLTHKYMGLDLEDKNINTFRKINNIKNKSLFIIRKGRKIKYYI